MLKILHASLQQYVKRELPDVQASFRKGKGIRDQITNFPWITEKAREFQKISTSVLLTTPKCVTVGITTNWKILKEMRVPDHLTSLLRYLCADQETTVKIGHGTTDWFQIGTGVCQGCILSSCFFNLYADYIMWNAGLDKIKLESRFLGEISITSDTQMTPPLWQKGKKN